MQRLREERRRLELAGQEIEQRQRNREREHEVERRQDAEHAPQVEVRQVHRPGGLALHPHQRGDEKAGEKEEHRDAEAARHAVHPGVRDEDDHEADRAQAIERRDVHRHRSRAAHVMDR
jgi:hypothetical protein